MVVRTLMAWRQLIAMSVRQRRVRLPVTIRDWLLLTRLNRRLIAGPLATNQAFVYFFAVLGFDGLQLAILDGSARDPGPLGPPAAGISFLLSLAFLALTYFANGAARGCDYFARYFSITALVGLYAAGPLQFLLRIPMWLPDLEVSRWYAPSLVVGTNLVLFAAVVLNIRYVAKNTRWSAA